jgi:hypothetical protein
MPKPKTLSPSQLRGAEAEPLRPPEFRRDRMGQFDRPGATLKKDQSFPERSGTRTGPPSRAKSRINLGPKEVAEA